MVEPVSRLLIGRGHVVIRARDAGLATEEDMILVEYSLVDGLVIVTFDPDLHRAVRRRGEGRCLRILAPERTARSLGRPLPRGHRSLRAARPPGDPPGRRATTTRRCRARRALPLKGEARRRVEHSAAERFPAIAGPHNLSEFSKHRHGSMKGRLSPPLRVELVTPRLRPLGLSASVRCRAASGRSPCP
jgi:hypothetical protein